METKKIVLVTGGASGIGRAAATCFTREGLHAVIFDVNREAGEAVAREIGGTFIACDATDPAQLGAGFDRVRQELGGIDVLIPNVGKNNMHFTRETSIEECNSFLKLNLNSVLYTCILGLPLLRDDGSIIITSSLVGVIGQNRSAVYSAAKGGINTYVKALALELAPRRITVNAIAPGDVMTPLYEAFLKTQPESYYKDYLSRIPMGRFAGPEEIGQAAVQLWRERYTTGTVHIMDGGKSLGTY